MPSNEYIHSHNKHYDLFHAILNNDDNKVASLINSGCIASFIDKKRLVTPLDTTIITDNAKICELLIKNGADVNSITDNKTAVTQILFSEHKNLDMLKLLLLYGGKLNFSFVINYNVRLEILTPCYMGKDLDDFLFLRKYHDPGRKIKPDY
ncbi:MAG: ankyrin repeat domain-containing protein [Treponema sp.]|nr:ankyrin repeat domain-containing protein [Treponema sp.]